MAQQNESRNASGSASQCPPSSSSSRSSETRSNGNGKTTSPPLSYAHYADEADPLDHAPDQTTGTTRYTDTTPDESPSADHHFQSPNSSPRASLSSFTIDDTSTFLSHPFPHPRARLQNRNRPRTHHLLLALLTLTLLLLTTSTALVVADHRSHARTQERRAFRRAVCEMRDGGERCRLLDGWARCVAEREGGREECARRVRERGEGVIGREGVYEGL